MKLLVDGGIAPRLAAELNDLFPGSTHVGTVGLGSASDAMIWDFAKTNAFTFLTKDKDFANLSTTLGALTDVILLPAPIDV